MVFTFFSSEEIMDKVVVVFSGGQDSTTILGLALHDGFEVYPISFNYGQRHAVELEMAENIVKALQAKGQPVHDLKVVDIRSFGQLVKSALTNPEMAVGQPHPMNAAVPSSFVPNRNAMLLTLSHAYAQHVEAEQVWTGVCQTDYSGYPDCRLDFVSQLQGALNTGYLTDIHFVTPLMFLTKAETFKMAADSDIMHEVLEYSHTCYEGNHTDKYEWGYGCGNCPACGLREKGYDEFMAAQNNTSLLGNF
jgi:7-cyano-7-deazaguanine synthase